jgi:hypothetical protein
MESNIVMPVPASPECPIDEVLKRARQQLLLHAQEIMMEVG